jgi:hypothetical protein
MKPPVAPQRWLEAEGPLPVLLRDAAREYGENLDPQAALIRHQARTPRPKRVRLLVPSFALAGALVLLALLSHFRTRSPDLLAQPEPERGPSHKQAEPAPQPSSVPAPHRSKVGFEPPRMSGSPARAALDSHSPAEPALSASASATRATPPPPANNAGEVGSGPAPAASSAPSADCLGFARAGDATKAEGCFEEQAAGQNLSAEVALYELARLRRDMLGKPAAALSALDDYARRFPHGYLSGEVLFSRLELLVKLGRSAEVLRASDELLASPSGKERALEIHFLRGNVYAHALGDPASAAREYAQAAAAPGRVGDDAAYLAAVNLQSAGDAAGASAAFEHYLTRAGARHSAEAQARLNALRAAAPSEPQ